ncbi:MAG TPA: hypothetical protein DD706_00900 [Nitrospiraceae bacterium]|nr:hypothetical protein [Nitrospiraceae bacterium]
MNLSSLNNPFRLGILSLLVLFISPLFVSSGHAVDNVNPLLREFPITVNPGALAPPTWWHVPGITPLIWTKDPISSDAYKTSESKTLNLKPGEYRFGTFTFDFLFKVTLSGTLEFSPTLDQCVDGRGTQVLTIRCSHTQPYPQEPDYPK